MTQALIEHSERSHGSAEIQPPPQVPAPQRTEQGAFSQLANPCSASRVTGGQVNDAPFASDEFCSVRHGFGRVERDTSAIVRGDLLERLYHLHGRSIYLYLLHHIFGNRMDAEDLLQETMLRAWRHIDDLTVDVELVRPWLYAIARHTLIDLLRARRTRQIDHVGTDPTTLSRPADSIERMLVATVVREGLMTLRDEYRQVLIEIFYKDRSVREASEALGIPEGTVKSRTFYGLRALGATTPMAGFHL
jgi:RNA polymerase sigma-70 factor, ECF subfamily